MKCNNKYCIFSYKGYCNHEDEKEFLLKGKKLDCKANIKNKKGGKL